jgi:hypothetical protein
LGARTQPQLQQRDYPYWWPSLRSLFVRDVSRFFERMPHSDDLNLYLTDGTVGGDGYEGIIVQASDASRHRRNEASELRDPLPNAQAD